MASNPRSRFLAPGAGAKEHLGVQAICLDQHAAQIQLTKQLLLLCRPLRLEHGPPNFFLWLSSPRYLQCPGLPNTA